MTYRERWADAVDGRALLCTSASGDWGLWLCLEDGQPWLCDDTMGGHLVQVRWDDDEAAGVRRYQQYCAPVTPPRKPYRTMPRRGRGVSMSTIAGMAL